MKRSALAILAFLFLSGCELFTPRESEPPIDILDPYAWRPPTSPEIVLENLANAFPALKPNYHLDVLSNNPEPGSNFTFVPDETVSNAQPDVFDAWGYEAEENFINKLFQSLSDEGLQHLDWQISQSNPIDNSYEIIADYHLTLSYKQTRADLPRILGGQATLTLEQNSELLYEISRWQDVKSDTLPCWSDLKTLVQ